MTVSHPDQIPSQAPSGEPTAGSGERAAGDGDKRPSTPMARSTSSPLKRARTAARKLIGRDRDKAKKDDPNIYPLF
jgi:hypothetical protein